MTSFATDEAIRAHVVERDLGEPLVFNQFVSLRLETSGELFREENGRASLYAPGHGDLFQALRRSGHARCPSRARCPDRHGVERRQPRRAHRSGRRRHAPPRPAAADLRGRAQGRRHGRSAGPRRREAPARGGAALPALVRAGRRAGLQHEHGALRPGSARRRLRPHLAVRAQGRSPAETPSSSSASTTRSRRWCPTQYLEVPRRGPRGRFSPIKTPADLERAQDDLRELVAASPL